MKRKIDPPHVCALARAAHEAGGHHVCLSMNGIVQAIHSETAQVAALVAAGGCGKSLWGMGKGNPFVRCGSMLTHVGGETGQVLCGACKERHRQAN